MSFTQFARTLLGGASAVILMFSATSLSFAAENPLLDDSLTYSHANSVDSAVLSSLERDELREWFDSYGVDSDTVNQLIAKFEHGIMWDSMKYGNNPVSSSRQIINDYIQVIDTYADGSIIVSTISNLDGIKEQALDSADGSGISLYSVSGCSYTSGGNYAGYWKNCIADVNLGLLGMGFTFDYQNIKDQGSTITGYRNYYHHVYGGSLTIFRFNRISATQVRLSADIAIAFGTYPVGWTNWMQANVSGSSAWTTHN